VKQPKPADALAEFERRLSAAAVDRYDLRLYVAGTTPRSTRAVRNLTRLCEAEIPGRYRLEIIDVYQQPLRAAEDQIVAVPTLLKIGPLPRRKLIGDLSQEAQVRRGLGLPDLPGKEEFR
jgi:circadian clock protein KaiB